MIKLVDQLNRPIQLKGPAKRIVSLVPSISELLFDIGLDDEVVGITKFCIKPEHWFRNKKRVGGTKTVSIEKVKALNPDLIIANKEENTQEEIEALSSLFPTYISDIETIPEAYQCLSDIGVLCHKQKETEKLIESIQLGFTELNGILNGSCLYFIWQNPFLVAGKSTFIDNILSHLGLENLALTKGGRYPELSVEEIKNMNPNLILLSSEPFPFAENHLSQIQDVFPNTKVVLVDGEAFSWYGSRLKHSLPYFKNLKNSLTI